MSQKLIYYSNLLIPGLAYIILDTITTNRAPLLEGMESNVTVSYISQLSAAAFALFSMWANFSPLKSRPTLAALSLSLSATLIIIQYFLRFDTNILWLLPMIALVYIFRYDHLTTPSK